jgi:hypothetical protein
MYFMYANYSAVLDMLIVCSLTYTQGTADDRPERATSVTAVRLFPNFASIQKQPSSSDSDHRTKPLVFHISLDLTPSGHKSRITALWSIDGTVTLLKNVKMSYVQVMKGCFVLLKSAVLFTDFRLTFWDEVKKESYPSNRPWRPIWLWDVEGPTLSRQSAHRWR